jgi:hypothetical protein
VSAAIILAIIGCGNRLMRGNVRILVCGMSRSGSTLLVKVLRKYFKKYHNRVAAVFPGKYYNNGIFPKGFELTDCDGRLHKFISNPANHVRHNLDLSNKDYIGKVHILNKSAPKQKFFSKFDLFFITRRDVRDATVSEIVSLKSQDTNKVLDTTGTLAGDNLMLAEIKNISDKLVKEHDSWKPYFSGKNPIAGTNKYFEWNYESFKEDEVSTFKNIFSYIREVYTDTYDITEEEIRILLKEIAKPIQLSDFGEHPEALKNPEHWAANNIKEEYSSRLTPVSTEKNQADGWDRGTSSTGGKIGVYKTFFNSAQIFYLNAKYEEWLNENGYKI